MEPSDLTGCQGIHGTFRLDRLFDGLVVLAWSDRMLDVRVGILGERARLDVRLRSRVVRTPVTPVSQTHQRAMLRNVIIIIIII